MAPDGWSSKSELEVEDDDPLERRPDLGRRGLVLGMRAVGVEARAILEVHGESVGEAAATMLGTQVLAPVEVDQARDRADQCAERDAACLDVIRGRGGTGLQEKNVPHHGVSIPKPRFGRPMDSGLAAPNLRDKLTKLGDGY